ncbi:hypothetical protein [Corynebacterium sp. A21]|uniref:hypothetical protein n=1 Tax=Corynebacterium sp. A21 TaxID=3457318 RepID=UPI003FCF1B82
MRFTTEELTTAKRIAEEITANGGGCRPTMKVMAVEPSPDQASEWDYDFEDPDTGVKYNTKENI